EVFAVIAHLERAAGVHHVAGGIGALAAGRERALAALGVDVRVGRRVSWTSRGTEVVVDGEAFGAAVVNADPLVSGGAADGPPATSGCVLPARARERLTLPHHLVLFSRGYEAEFAQLFAGQPAD